MALHIPQALREAAAAAGGEVFLVGGSVRDLLLGRVPPDFDVAASAGERVLAAGLARSSGGRVARIETAGEIVYRVLAGSHRWDVSPLAGGSLAADLSRRDFTINAMAFDLRRNRLVDPWGGKGDLKAGRLRMVRADALEKDSVRILRAHRIAAQLDFRIEPETAAAIRRRVSRLRREPPERIHGEIAKLMQSSLAARELRRMEATGAVFAVFPELEALRRCPAAGCHDRDGWRHTLDVVEGVERRLACPGRLAPGSADAAEAHFDADRSARIKTAALLHDVGKPASRSTAPDGRLRYHGHDRCGADMADSICRRLRCSNREREHVVWLVRRHLRLMLLFSGGHRKREGDRAVARLLREAGVRLPDLAVLALADAEAKGPRRSGPERRAFERFALGLVEDHFRAEASGPGEGPARIDGNDLIARFGLRPSPLFRKLLDGVEEARIAGAVRTREEALSWVEKVLQRSDV